MRNDCGSLELLQERLIPIYLMLYFFFVFEEPDRISSFLRAHINIYKNRPMIGDSSTHDWLI